MDDWWCGGQYPLLLISPNDLEAYLMTINNISKEAAKKIVDEMYKERYGISREEHRQQLQGTWMTKPFKE